MTFVHSRLQGKGHLVCTAALIVWMASSLGCKPPLDENGEPDPTVDPSVTVPPAVTAPGPDEIEEEPLDPFAVEESPDDDLPPLPELPPWPVEEPVEETPFEEAPAEEPVEAEPAEEAPAEVPLGEPVEEEPVEADPAEEAPEEAPAEVPLGEPVEEEPAEEEPVEEAPAEEIAEEEIAEEETDDAIDYVATPAVEWMLEPYPVEGADAADADSMEDYTEVIPGTEVTFEMVAIPGGTFVMGSPEDEADRHDDEGPQFQVELEPFWMGRCEVTWDEYELWAMNLDRLRREHAATEATERDQLADALSRPTLPYTDMTFGMGKANRPAGYMTQLAAQMYCKWLTAKTGRYYRLPTEAEWEYAARAGTTTPYFFGDDPDDLEEYAWFFENADGVYQRVGTRKPNPWGLHDMYGNMMEWVLDGYAEGIYAEWAAKDQPVANPFNPPTEYWGRVVRGGHFDDDPENLRSAARRYSERNWKNLDPQLPQSIWYVTEQYDSAVGFRVVRPLRVPTAEEAARFEPDAELIREYQYMQAGKM